MIEVPVRIPSATILLIGSGQLSKHLIHWFNLNKNHSTVLLTWDRHQDPHALHRYAAQSTHVWLAISDGAIVSFYEKFLAGHDVRVVHFNGALHDPRLIAAHPLMSFPAELYPDDFYSQIQFALTGCNSLNEALPGFKNSYFPLAAENKPLYHALCVMAGNFPQILWNEVENCGRIHRRSQRLVGRRIHLIPHPVARELIVV